jgi:aryl-alcohol dehydrogenase-like predicted oxidoreductase
MEYTRLGNTGLKVSRIGLGCMSYGVPERGPHPWSLDEEKSRPFLRRALDLGINFFDTANVYSMQNHYNLLYREEEREMMPLCRDQGVGVIPWSPLARGRLTRPWEQRGATERAGTDKFGKTLYSTTEEADRAVAERVGAAAEKRGVPRAQVALAWMLGKPFVTSPIIGATKMQHLEDAVAALSVKLSAAEAAALEEPYVPHPVLGFS